MAYKEYVYKNGEFCQVSNNAGGTSVKVVNELPTVGRENTIYVKDNSNGWVDDIRIKKVVILDNPEKNKSYKVPELIIETFPISSAAVNLIKTTDRVRLLFNGLKRKGRRKGRHHFKTRDSWGNFSATEITNFLSIKAPQVLPEHIRYNQDGMPYIYMIIDLVELVSKKIKAVGNNTARLEDTYTQRFYHSRKSSLRLQLSIEEGLKDSLSYSDRFNYFLTASRFNDDTTKSCYLVRFKPELESPNPTCELITKEHVFEFVDTTNILSTPNSLNPECYLCLNPQLIYNRHNSLDYTAAVGPLNSWFPTTSINDWKALKSENGGYWGSGENRAHILSTWFFKDLESNCVRRSSFSDKHNKYIVRENICFSFAIANSDFKSSGCPHIWKKRFNLSNKILNIQYNEYMAFSTNNEVITWYDPVLQVKTYIKSLPNDSKIWK